MIFKKTILAIFLWTFLLPLQTLGAGSEISRKLDIVAETLVSTYEKKSTESEKVSLAVLPFHAGSELAKRRAGIAIAELLTHSFRSYERFKIVERIEFEKIMNELHLNASGVAEAEEALKVGKLSGAKLQVLGSIEKIGSKYHINARMVETESGEVFATAYETLPADLFEEQAKTYLVPVPETQAIGIYFLYTRRHLSPASEPFSYSTGWENITISPNSAALNQMGLGFRYFPYKNFVIDVSGFFSGKMKEGAVKINSSRGYTHSESFFTKAYRLLLNYDLTSNKHFHIYAGPGIIWYDTGPDSRGDYSSPLVNFRFEYRPQDRIALSLGGSYELNKAGWKINWYDSPPIDTHEPSQFSIESSIGFYF